MGGYGSGRPGIRPVASENLQLKIIKPVLECLKKLDNSEKPSACSTVYEWHNVQTGDKAGAIKLILTNTNGLKIILDYTANGEPMVLPIAITTTETIRNGGRRYWLTCPECNRRVSILYGGVNKSFDCRHCLHITYRSCNESGRMFGYYELLHLQPDPTNVKKMASWQKKADRSNAYFNARFMARMRSTSELFALMGKPDPLPAPPPEPTFSDLLEVLSAREKEVLAVWLEKGSNWHTATAKLNIARGTLKTHLYYIYGRLGVHNKKELRKQYKKQLFLTRFRYR